MIRRTTIATLLFLLLYFVSGCSNNEDMKERREELRTIEFSESTAVMGGYEYIITTQNRTIVWAESSTQFKKTDEPKDFITYEEDDDGDMYNGIIHLSDRGLKKYSRTYAKNYGATLTIKR